MKKVLIAAVALMMGASLSFAGLSINWSNGGWMVAFGGDLNEGPGVGDANDVLWQLIWAGANNVADDIDLAADNFLGGDDELLSARTIPAGGGSTTSTDGKVSEWDGWLMNQSGETLYQDLASTKTGYMYQRIFQGLPDEGIYYFETDLVEMKSISDATTPPQVFEYDAAGNGLVVNQQIPAEPGPGPEPPTPVIPEPATMSLLGLGALAMVLRRKLSK